MILFQILTLTFHVFTEAFYFTDFGMDKSAIQALPDRETRILSIHLKTNLLRAE